MPHAAGACPERDSFVGGDRDSEALSVHGIEQRPILQAKPAHIADRPNVMRENEV
jgi:hypothetical protein